MSLLLDADVSDAVCALCGSYHDVDELKMGGVEMFIKVTVPGYDVCDAEEEGKNHEPQSIIYNLDVVGVIQPDVERGSGSIVNLREDYRRDCHIHINESVDDVWAQIDARMLAAGLANIR